MRNQGASAELPFADACALLDSIPDLADRRPQLRRDIYAAFRLTDEVDRNAGQIRLRAPISSALSEIRNLDDVVANKAIAGAGYEHLSPTAYQLVEVRQLP